MTINEIQVGLNLLNCTFSPSLQETYQQKLPYPPLIKMFGYESVPR